MRFDQRYAKSTTRCGSRQAGASNAAADHHQIVESLLEGLKKARSIAIIEISGMSGRVGTGHGIYNTLIEICFIMSFDHDPMTDRGRDR